MTRLQQGIDDTRAHVAKSEEPDLERHSARDDKLIWTTHCLWGDDVWQVQRRVVIQLQKNSQRCWHQSLPSDKLKLYILTAIFPGGPGFNVFILDFIGATGDGGGGDNWSYKTCKAPVKSSPPKNKHTIFNRPDALPVAQPTLSKHWRKNITFHGLVHPKLTWGSSNFVSDH